MIARNSPVAYALIVLLAYVLAAAALGVNLVFAAFLAGFAVSVEREMLSPALDAIAKFSFALFVPLYFATVGYRLNLGRDFSFAMLAVVLCAACAVKLASVWLGARVAGFRGLDTMNLAMAFNARGGPGIVLASVAYDAGIVNAQFYTTLVLLAVITSQIAGFWLDYVLRRGWPLLSGDRVANAAAVVPVSDEQQAA